MPRSFIEITELKDKRSYRLESSYDESWVQWLKQAVPYGERAYEEIGKTWEIKHPRHLGKILAEAPNYFDQATFVRRGETGALRYRNLHTGRESEQPVLVFENN